MNASASQQAAIKAAIETFDGDISQLAAALIDYAEQSPADSASPLPKTLRQLPTLSNLKRIRKRAVTPIIAQLDNVTRHYKMGKNTVGAITDVSLTIHEGEFVAITGASGSGKSTLLNLIGGLDRPDSGTITVAGNNLATLTDAKLSEYRNHTVGFVFQFFYLQPFLSVAANLEVPAMFGRLPVNQRRKQITALAEAVGITDRLGHLPKELSGGQMQRAAIARALVNQPKILLADEPTGNLDSTNSQGIMELFRQVRQDFGTTIIVITHDQSIASIADRTISMHDGRVS